MEKKAKELRGEVLVRSVEKAQKKKDFTVGDFLKIADDVSEMSIKELKEYLKRKK